MEQLVHTLSTALALLFAFAAFVAAGVASLRAKQIARARKRIDAFDEALDELGGEIGLLQNRCEELERRHQQNLGRIGALKARVMPPKPDLTTEHREAELDEAERLSERRALELKLAERTSNGR